MPSFPIIDAHIHLYDRSKVGYRWMEREWPEIDHPHLMRDLDQARGPIEIEQAIFCEVRPDEGEHFAEAEFIQAVSRDDPRLAAMTAYAPLHKGRAAEEDLARLCDIPIVRGVRYHLPQSPAPDFNEKFVEAVKAVGRRGLHYEIAGPPLGLKYASAVARRCPEVPFVLVHLGSPDVASGSMNPWRREISEFAKLDNVIAVKISGTVSFAGKTWVANAVRPYLSHAIESFGFDRCMYGSDWPASSFAHAYRDWVDLIDDVLRGASADEQRKLYRDTATRVFRLHGGGSHTDRVRSALAR